MEEFTELPGMHDTAIIAVCLICLIAGIVGAAIYLHVKRLDEGLLTIIERTERSFGVSEHLRTWAFAILVGFMVLFAVAWTTADEGEHIARAALRDPRLSVALEQLHCAPPAAPLEKIIIAVGTQAAGKTPQLFCTYVTADLGVVPKIRTATAEQPQ